MLAINVAALADRIHGGLQPSSLQQLYNSYVLIKSVSTSGYLPVTFNLFTLHMVDMVSWYLLVLTAVTLAVSVTTFFAVGNFNPSIQDLDSIQQAASTGGPAECGYNIPGAWCYTPLEGSYYQSEYYGDYQPNPSNGASSMLAFCLVVYFLLVARHMGLHSFLLNFIQRWQCLKLKSTRNAVARWSKRIWQPIAKSREIYFNIQTKVLRHQYVRRYRRWSQDTLYEFKRSRWRNWPTMPGTDNKEVQRRKHKTIRYIHLQWLLTKEAAARSSSHYKSLVAEFGYPNLIKATLLLCLYIIFLGLYVNFFNIFCNDLAWFASNGIDRNSWSFGQVVAITVWVAPVCEWLHLEMRKSCPSKILV